jgi:hypothetical protein|tara:strand:- start:144 stop:404 length:261 start_codon:yes stop_codon:yes gene_type:complete
MGRSAGNLRIKKKLIQSLQQVENPDEFQIDEILDFYKREHGKYYKVARIARLLKPYADPVGNKSRTKHWVVKDKWRYIYEEENCND